MEECRRRQGAARRLRRPTSSWRRAYFLLFPDLYRRVSDFADKILRGLKPADIPVEQPTKFDLVFNRTTAKALGIEIRSRLLFTADEVIE